MPVYTLVDGPCDGQTMELDLDNLERMNWLVDVPTVQDVAVSIWGFAYCAAYTLPVRATYRLDGGANSVRLQFVSSRPVGSRQTTPNAQHVSMEWTTAWEIIQQEMNRRQMSGILNPVFHRDRVSAPTTILDSMNGVRRYMPGPTVHVTWVDEEHNLGSLMNRPTVLVDESHFA